MVAFWIIIGFFTPLFIILLDYLIKSSYLLVYENIYKSRLYELLDYINKGSGGVTLKRKTIDGKYIIKLKYYPYITKPQEYLCDKKGNIKILGTSEKSVKYLFDNKRNYAPINIKLPKDIKGQYINIIYGPEEYPDIDDISNGFKPKVYGPLLPLNLKSPIHSLRKKINPNELSLNNPINNEEILIRRMIINIYRKRTKSMDNLREIVKFNPFVRDCIMIYRANESITVTDVDDLLTDKIMEYAYE